MNKLLIGLIVLCSSVIGNAAKPFCSSIQINHQLIIGYLGADSSWSLKNADQTKLTEQLQQVSVINYSFIRLGKDNNGNTVLTPSQQDIENIQLLRLIKPDLPLMIAVGGWGERDGFQTMLTNEAERDVFIKSVRDLLERYHLDGIDVDWENELLASDDEINGVAMLLQQLHDTIGKEGYCVTNAVPATQAYWTKYPDARLWQEAVNWTTVMAYDHYGTFGPRTEHAAALYEPNRKNDERYPYPNASGHEAVRHYYEQGLPADKIILGLPFYCHSYYVNNQELIDSEEGLGVHVPAVDPNISSQISYADAYNMYADGVHRYALMLGDEDFHAATFYGLIPIERTDISRFLSCEGPQSIVDKIAYVKGKNPFKKTQQAVKLGGVSFWSLQQDLPFSHPQSLLQAIHKGFVQ